ncbi:MAG: ribonuclease III [Firmicutes bacterium]|nr:ribonuclease III [Bacillota bacterium]
MDAGKLNTTSLAYIGDAVYEVYVRKYVMRRDAVHTDVLHKRAIAFVRAEGQASVIKRFVKEHKEAAGESADFDSDAVSGADMRFILTAEEAALVRRARNRKSATKPKNTDPVTYKWATAFEALVGYLYLTEQTARLDLFANTAISYIENGLRQK